ncbi:MAG: hypothetical protein K0S11_367 [Gammaproteobacteria bacterium]|nr:hypothetical protein [Gammaproteobacteria bacterium]
MKKSSDVVQNKEPLSNEQLKQATGGQANPLRIIKLDGQPEKPLSSLVKRLINQAETYGIS